MLFRPHLSQVAAPKSVICAGWASGRGRGNKARLQEAARLYVARLAVSSSSFRLISSWQRPVSVWGRAPAPEARGM
jgi:hypothetical protein